MLIDGIIHFRENFGDKVKGRSQKKHKSFIPFPIVAHLKVQFLIYNMILISSPWRVLRPSYPFREIFGDRVKGRSPKKLKLMIEVPYVVHLKVQVLSFNMILISSAWRVCRPSYSFRGKFGRLVKDRTPKKQKSLIRVPYVAHLKVQVLSFNMILLSSPLHVARANYPFWGKFGRSGKGSFTEKFKIVSSSSL